VSEPEKKMQDVCLFLNLPFEPAMAESHQSGMYSKFNTNKEKGFRKVHEKVFQPINAALIDSWRGRIPQMELSAVEAIAGKFGEAYYGYKQTNPDIKVKLGTLSYFMMDLKYRAIKTLYRKALSNFWLYYRIKRNVWRNF
jgi:hypothetical protein